MYTGRTTKITSKITGRTTGTGSEKKPISYQKMSDSVPNCKLQFSGFIVSFSVFQFKSNQIQLFPENDAQVEQKFEILRISHFCFSFHTFP